MRRFIAHFRCLYFPKVVTVGFIILLMSGCTFTRFVVYNFSDIKDYKKFPSREIDKPETPFSFTRLSADDPNRLTFPAQQSDGKEVSFEELMEDNKTVALMVIKNDTIVYENYFAKYDTASIVPSFSMAKSFVSALMGIAVEEGHIKSVKEPITNYIPELSENDPRFNNITIEHVLNMESGIEYEENYYNPFGNVAVGYYGTNLVKHVSKLKIEKEPGGGSEYKSIDTQILGLIVERATKTKLATYLEEKIWKPLGMEYDASWSIDSKRNDTEKAFCCINARAADFAKFGRLYLNRGQWNGTQIVPEKWVAKTADAPGGYAYQWWLQRNDHYAAVGHLGQYIYIAPEENVVIVRLGKQWGNVGWTNLFYKITQQLK